MKNIFDTCQPRDEVLTGELRDQMFAARLRDVVERPLDAIREARQEERQLRAIRDGGVADHATHRFQRPSWRRRRDATEGPQTRLREGRVAAVAGTDHAQAAAEPRIAAGRDPAREGLGTSALRRPERIEERDQLRRLG